MATLPSEPPQTFYIQYTAPTYASPNDYTFGSIILVDKDEKPVSCGTLAYKTQCAITLDSAYRDLNKTGDDFEIEGISFWGMFTEDGKTWQPASAIVRTFMKGDKGDVYFDS